MCGRETAGTAGEEWIPAYETEKQEEEEVKGLEKWEEKSNQNMLSECSDHF